MKLLKILTESISIPFKKKCIVTIHNNDGEEINVNCEIPTTPEEITLGLMYRDNLSDDCGVLYTEVDGGFWMKNVKFPIEMVFISDGQIVDIVKAEADSEKTIYPPNNCDMNLEVNDGFSDKNNISIGNKIYKS